MTSKCMKHFAVKPLGCVQTSRSSSNKGDRRRAHAGYEFKAFAFSLWYHLSFEQSDVRSG